VLCNYARCKKYKNFSDELHKQWALLHLFDWLNPTYDQPQTIETFTDWLEKDTIDVIDIQTANKILFYGISSQYIEKLNINVSKNTPQYTVITDVVSGALYNHDFFVSKSGLELLVKMISNLISQYHTDLLRSDTSKERQKETEALLDKLEKENKLKFKREDTEYLIREFDTFISSDVYNHLMIFSKQI
jgi:hypothetical protein